MNISKDEYNRLLYWIKNNIIEDTTFNDIKTSYGLKHLFEFSKDGFYVENDVFKQAMLDSGYKVEDTTELNWVFNISNKSPALKDFV